MSSSYWARALTMTLFKSARSQEQWPKVNNVTSRKRGFEADLSGLPCSLRAGRCQVSPCTFTSSTGRETLPATKVLLPSLFYPRVDGFGKISFTICPSRYKYLAIAPELPFPKIQLFSCPCLRIDFPPYVPSMAFSVPKLLLPQRVTGQMPFQQISTLLCVRTMLTWPITWI